MTLILWKTAGLLILSNVFMTFAWYAHLKNLSGKPWLFAHVASHCGVKDKVIANAIEITSEYR